MHKSRICFVVLCLLLAGQGCKGGGGPTTTTTTATATTTTVAGNDNCTYCIKHEPLGLEGCRLFPPDTFVHADIRSLPVHPKSDTWIAKLGGSAAPVRLPVGLDLTKPLAPIRYGSPISCADGGTRRVKVYNDYVYTDQLTYTGLWPMPDAIDVESIGDRHTYILETDECAAYEMLGFFKFPVYRASAGVRWDLGSHSYQPKYGSVLAAGIPGLAMLLRADEVRAGRVDHVLGFAIPETKLTAGIPEKDYLWPARHSDGTTDDPDAVPIGAWLRLKQSVDTTDFPASVRVVAEALKVHGVLLVDTGGNTATITMGIEKTAEWTDAEGNNIEADLASIARYVFAGDFEVVDTTDLRLSDTSMQIK